MFSVPLGTPLPAVIWASLISSLARGPERIGLEAAGSPWPQATPPTSASMETIAKVLFSMGCTSGPPSFLWAFVDLAVAQLRVQADAQPVPEHVRRQHEHG